MDYKQALKFYPNFPIEGVNFVDIIPLMQDKHLFKSLISDLGALCSSCNIAAPEARGFLFAAPMLTCCDNIHNVIPMRKKGKLPHAEGDHFEVSFFDDVLATGGTALGIARGLEQHKVVIDDVPYGIKVTDFVFLVEIDDLDGRGLLETIAPVKSLIHI